MYRSKMSRTKKPSDAKSMITYTARDMGQEYLMKRKTVYAVVVSIVTVLALIAFIALYVDECKRVQETYRAQYATTLRQVVEDIESYQNAEGDLEFRYRRITADMNTAASFLFLLDEMENEKKAVQELYTVILRYPVQAADGMEEIKTALNDILANLDKGYDEVRSFVDGIDKKGY